MRYRIVPKLVAFGLLVFCFQANLQAALTLNEPPNWYTADKQLLTDLIDGKQSFPVLAKKIAARYPKTGQEAMYKLDVLLRAGMDREAIGAVTALKNYSPKAQGWSVGWLASISDNFECWKAEKALYENYADDAEKYGGSNPLPKRLLKQEWSIEQVDAWLAKMPTGKDNYWVKERLVFAYENGAEKNMIYSLGDSVRKSPKDIDGVVKFLQSLNSIRGSAYIPYSSSGKRDIPNNLSWILEYVMPDLAFDNYQIAQALYYLREYNAAEVYYRRASQIPLTEEDGKKYGKKNGTDWLKTDAWRLEFEIDNNIGLALSVSELGRNEEAQKLYQENNDMRNNREKSFDVRGYGNQQSTIKKTEPVDEKLMTEEKQSANDPNYWLRRANYHTGRDEIDMAVDACKKGLALAVPAPIKENGNAWDTDLRTTLVYNYFFLREKQHSNKDAYDILIKEVADYPNSVSAARSVYYLVDYCEKFIKGGDQVLWNWLANHKTWGDTENRLLTAMMDNTELAKRDIFFTYAAELAKDGDPGNACMLGTVLNKYAYFDRSIPLLETAMEKSSDGTRKKTIGRALFDAYLAKNRWRDAEKMIPYLREGCLVEGYSGYFARIAIVAAKSEEKADALRLWKFSANLNPAEMSRLNEISGLGLRDDLIIYYRDFQKKLPTSNIPAIAFRILGVKSR